MEDYGNRRGNSYGRQTRNEGRDPHQGQGGYGSNLGDQSRPYGEDYGDDYGDDSYHGGGGFERRNDPMRNDWQQRRYGEEGHRGSSLSSGDRNREQDFQENTDFRSGAGGRSRGSDMSMRPDRYPNTYRRRESGYMSQDDYDRGSPHYRSNRQVRFGGHQGRPDHEMQRNRGEERDYWDRTKDEVASWFGDDEAARRRELDKHRGKGPKNYKRSDERIQEEINDMLTDDPYVDASEIEVKVKNGEVTLTGTVDNRATKRRAEDIAEQVSGVTHVENRLRATNVSAHSTGWY